VHVESYPGELTDALAELVARARALGAFTSDNPHLAALDRTAGRLLADVAAGGGPSSDDERCSVCAALIETESWDTPVGYCPNDCDPDTVPTPQAPLAAGDVLESYPCQVRITRLAAGTGTLAATPTVGRCATCGCEHVIDAARFDAGRGPWRRVSDRAPAPL
jgi:hypothetical protein